MDTLTTKFTIDNATEIKEYYKSQGYVVVENLLSHAKIDDFIEQYEKVKCNKLFLYRSQSTHIPSRPKITPEGFMEESMSDPINLKLFPKFSGATLRCLIDDNISTVLNILSGASSHTIWQTMFFDKSTGTIEHQDHYYLDTNPPGHLIGAWYALENINEEAGCFFVLPGSHQGKIIDREKITTKKTGIEGYFSDYEQMRKKIMNLIQENKYEYKIFPLNKGDVLFWHPNTIHGAYKNQNPQFSRKSFTAHYYPSHLERLYDKGPKTKKSANQNILIRKNELRLLARNMRFYTTYLLNQITDQRPLMDMRRESYSDDYTK